MTAVRLLAIAKKVLRQSKISYPGIRTGAVLETKRGKLYTGCSIEIEPSYASVCAEGIACLKAAADGKAFGKTILIAGEETVFPYPCGTCRQLLYDMGGAKMKIILANKKNELQIMTIGDLLPFPPKIRKRRAPTGTRRWK